MQDQITFTTPVQNHVVVIKGWMSGRDEQAIQNAISEKLQLTIGTDGKPGSVQTNAAVMSAGQDKALELLVISVDGKTDNAKDLVLDMHRDDYHCVKEQIDKVTNSSEAAQEAAEEKKDDSSGKQSPADAAAVAPLTEG